MVYFFRFMVRDRVSSSFVRFTLRSMVRVRAKAGVIIMFFCDAADP